MDEWKYSPSADQGLPPFASLKSLKREPGLVSFLLQMFWSTTGLLYMKIVHRLRIRGLEYLPKAAPFVLVSNHASHLDTVALVSAIPAKLRSHSYPIAAGDHFFHTKRHTFFAAMFLNALPMWRRQAVGHALNDLRAKLLTSETIFILFPEGTRSRNGTMGAFKPGIGKLVSETQIPVIPVYVDGTFNAFPAGAKLPRPARVSLTFGPALSFETTPNTRDGWRAAGETLRNAVAALHP